MPRLVSLCCLGVICGAAAILSAADKFPSYLSERTAGPDFAIQGEYAGAISDDENFGLQVIALGESRFDAVLYPGGLPGAGWDGKKRFTMTSIPQDGVIALQGDKVSGTIKDRTFTGQGTDGVKYLARKVLRKSPTLNAKPPKGALVLFDGSHVEHWQDGKLEDEKLLGVGTRTKQKFKNFTLHLEFRTPFMPTARGQARGNSGMYLLDQYECQILDSFGLTGEDNECGGIYQVAKPDVNMCLPPLSWQTYDVEFQAAVFDDAGNRKSPAVTTIKHNGVAIHQNRNLDVTTPGGLQSDELPGALFLQDHNNPVRFRNIWIVEK